MFLFVGLGNPGPTYENTRHNIGFRILDRLIEKEGARAISGSKFDGELYRKGELLFLKPLTFMNLSGKSVASIKSFFKIPLANIVVIHDDIDLSFGEIRLKRGGGNGGHNGLKSIDNLIGKDYIRLRIGVGKPEKKSMVANYVLSNFLEDEEAKLPCLIDYATSLAQKIPNESINRLKSLYTLKKSDDPCSK